MKDYDDSVRLMTVRDCFAAAALAGMLAFEGQFETKSGKVIDEAKGFAKEAYVFADAMLKERAK